MPYKQSKKAKKKKVLLLLIRELVQVLGFFIAAIAIHNKFCGLKQHILTILQFCRLDSTVGLTGLKSRNTGLIPSGDSRVSLALPASEGCLHS